MQNKKIKLLAFFPSFILVLVAFFYFSQPASAVQYGCSLNGTIYADQTACLSSCLQKANCSPAAVNVSGTASGFFNMVNGVSDRIDFLNCYSISADFKACLASSKVGSLSISGTTVSGSARSWGCFGAPPPICTAAGFWQVYTNGTSEAYFSNSLAAFPLTFSGAKVSGATASGTISTATGSGNNIIFNTGSITITGPNVCPLPGASACSGSPSTCTKTGTCTAVAPTCSSSWSPAGPLTAPASSTFFWNSTNATSATYSCSGIIAGSGATATAGSLPLNFSSSQTGTETCTVTVSGPGGLANCSGSLIISSPPNIDCGLRVRESTATVSIACEPLGTLTSPMRIAKAGNIYGIVLVDPTDANASKTRIKTSSGIKALRKF